jgi:hypothetical protein
MWNGTRTTVMKNLTKYKIKILQGSGSAYAALCKWKLDYKYIRQKENTEPAEMRFLCPASEYTHLDQKRNEIYSQN